MSGFTNPWATAPAPKGSIGTPPPKAPPTNPMDTADGSFSNPWGGKPLPEPPIAPVAKKTATLVGKALDAQGYQVRKALTHETDTDAQMTKIRHAIPGMDWFYQARAPNTGVPFLDHIQNVANHASQGLTDAAIQQVLDPLTYETALVGGPLKGVAKTAGKALMRVTNSNPLTRMVFDALHWGGKVAREQGPEVVQTVRGASNRASTIGGRVEQHINDRVANIIDGKPIKNVASGKVTPGVKLEASERLQVGKALNGEVPVEELTAKERTAYRQLRTLTNLDYHLRQQTARTIALQQYGKDLSAADRASLEQAFASDKEPVVPEPSKRVRKYYGEPQPRARTIEGPPPPEPTDLFARFTEAMNPADKAQLGKSLTQQHVFDSLPEDLKAKSQAIKDAMQEKYRPSSVATVVPLKPQARYTFKPENFEAIEHATKLRDMYRDVEARVEAKVPRRENYMPFVHYGDKPTEGADAFKVNPTEYYDPRTKQREDLKVDSPAQIQHGFEAMASNTNRQVTTKAIHDSLGQMLNDPEINKLFEETIKATGDKRTDIEQAKDMWKGLVGYPRAAVVSLTPRHAANILDLLANTVPAHQLPQAMGETMALAAKLVKASPKEYYALTKEGRDLGALSGSFAERKAFFQKFPDFLPVVGGKSTGPLGAWTRLNNKLVWAIDEAAKQTYAKMIAKSGEADGLRAGGLASQRLVDYSHVSPLQKALRYVAPFGTFRGAIPGAVAGGIARNPARAAFLNRATGGAFYGGQPAPGQPGVGLSLPTAEVGRAASYAPGAGKTVKAQERNVVSGPGNFLRGTIGAPFQAAGGLAQDILAPSSRPPHWAMYGEPWLPKRDKHGKLDLGFLMQSALAGVPEAQAMLSAMGLNHFQWRGLPNEAARQTFGIDITPQKAASPVAPPTTPAPSDSGGFVNPWK